MIQFSGMAWRIDEQVIRGEIDNRIPGKVTGQLWLVGRSDPVVLELEGNPWRDLAGHLLKFTNPAPKEGDQSGLSAKQAGVVGDITASRKVKVPDCSMEELMNRYANREDFPWHWGNLLYLEWFSATNGRVVLESASYQLLLDPEPTWSMSETEESAQSSANADAMMDFMGRMGMAAGSPDNGDEEDEDEPSSRAEALADAEDEWMQTLMDRVTARIERAGIDQERFEVVYEEERARLKRERGIKEVELTPEEREERRQWIEEMNEMAAEALVDVEADQWQDGKFAEERHPLVDECSDLSVQLFKEIHAAGWLPEDAQEEHPLREVINGVTFASAKLAGALGMADRYDEWPPDPLIAGNVLVRLKKARGHLRDAMRGLDSAEEENLATPQWRHHMRLKIIDVLAETQNFIREVRQGLEAEEDDDLGIF
jgi:hypothetical protein